MSLDLWYSELRAGLPSIAADALLPLMRDMDRRITELEENLDRTQAVVFDPDPRG